MNNWLTGREVNLERNQYEALSNYLSINKSIVAQTSVKVGAIGEIYMPLFLRVTYFKDTQVKRALGL